MFGRMVNAAERFKEAATQEGVEAALKQEGASIKALAQQLREAGLADKHAGDISQRSFLTFHSADITFPKALGRAAVTSLSKAEAGQMRLLVRNVLDQLRRPDPGWRAGAHEMLNEMLTYHRPLAEAAGVGDALGSHARALAEAISEEKVPELYQGLIEVVSGAVGHVDYADTKRLATALRELAGRALSEAKVHRELAEQMIAEETSPAGVKYASEAMADKLSMAKNRAEEVAQELESHIESRYEDEHEEPSWIPGGHRKR